MSICINLQKISLFHMFILLIQSIFESHHMTSYVHFNHANPKIFKHLLICRNLYQQAKTHLISLVQSWNTVNFRVQWPDWLYSHFWPCLTKKIFTQLLFFVNFYQLVKNKAVSSICSGEIVHLKILQSDWLILDYISGTR